MRLRRAVDVSYFEGAIIIAYEDGATSVELFCDDLIDVEGSGIGTDVDENALSSVVVDDAGEHLIFSNGVKLSVDMFYPVQPSNKAGRRASSFSNRSLSRIVSDFCNGKEFCDIAVPSGENLSSLNVSLRKRFALRHPEAKFSTSVDKYTRFIRFEFQRFGGEYLTEDSLGDVLEMLYPDVHDWVKDKPIGNGFRIRPDYRSDSLMLCVEYDGPRHYTDGKTIVSDEKKFMTYHELGYKVVRVPYFIQLDKHTSYALFGVSSDINSSYPHGFVNKNTTLPSSFCQLGLFRFSHDISRFDQYVADEVRQSLEDFLAMSSFPYEVIPPDWVFCDDNGDIHVSIPTSNEPYKSMGEILRSEALIDLVLQANK